MTQAEEVRRFMREHGSITSMQAFTELGVTRLAARIHDLKKAGLKINSQPHCKKNRYGRMVTYHQCSLIN